MTARDLLLEIGVEELPVSFLRSALESMREESAKLFADARLIPSGATRVVGTPRRLTLLVTDIPERQPERRDRVVGPPWSAAFKDGKPTKAAEGFAKKNGVAVDALQKHTTDKGDYVAANVHEPGRAAKDVLPELLTELCRRVRFPKSMRWGLGDIAFGRPVHWLVALFGDDVVPVEFASVQAGRATRGHRFLAAGAFDVTSPATYEKQLEAAHVIVDPDERKRRMHALLAAEAKKLGGVLVEDAFLLEECASLVEEPFVVPGGFDDSFSVLPDDVIVLVMKHHQRYFAVRRPSGAIQPAYLNVVNTANAPDVVRKGNDRVLRARLADASFFVAEDAKTRLSERAKRLDGVVFQAKLGSIGDKVRRIEFVARWLASTTGADAEATMVAARLCKADLETLVVGEFPELQGRAGQFYAVTEQQADERAGTSWEGLTQSQGIEVLYALGDQYRPKGADDAVPDRAVAAVVATADRADTLVGCFGIGLEPTGSADPFALRRAALGVIRIALEGPIDVDLHSLLNFSLTTYGTKISSDPNALIRKLGEFFRGRLRAMYRERFSGDLVDACIGAWEGGSIRDLDARVHALHVFRAKPELDSLTVAFKRTFNIASDAPEGDVDPRLLESGAERELAERFGKISSAIDSLVAHGEYGRALTLIGQDLREPIDRYFEQVFVMVDDEVVRTNRLRLLGQIAKTVRRIAHFDQLSS